MTSALAQTLNDALPQTQCTRCGYPECLAYAQAGKAAINQCPPGGAEGISRLAALTGRPLLPLSRRSSGKAGMHADSRLCKTNRPGTPRPMDALSSIQSFGLELPGPAYIFGAIVFGLIGLVAFRRGRQAGQRTTLWLGVALMVFPWGRAVAELRRIAHRLEGLRPEIPAR